LCTIHIRASGPDDRPAGARPPEEVRMNRNRWILVALLLAVAVLGASWWRSRSAAATPKYRTAEADRGSIESVVSATGTVRPVIQVEIGSQVSGTVDKLHADFNSRVRAGQVIAELEPSSFRAREVQADAAVIRAQASVKDGERALGRAQELFSQKYISQADLDAATVALELRKADLKQAQAQLEAARVDRQHATIRSPIDGVVISRSVDLGQTVAASLQAPTLFVIAKDLSHMQVECRIDEADIGRIRAGLPAEFTVDAFPDRTFTGHVAQVRLEPIVDSGVVTYTTVLQTANRDLTLRPGMTANVTIRIERRDDVLRIPNAALRFRPPPDAGGRGGEGRGGSGSVATAGIGGSGAGEAGAATRPEGGSAPGGSAHRGHSGRGKHHRGLASGDSAAAAGHAPGARPASIYVLRGGTLEKVKILTGITDGSFTEVRGGELQPGDPLIVASNVEARGSSNLQPPPGMGGPTFRGPGAGRTRR
jgi:HlyD family secretion protein